MEVSKLYLAELLSTYGELITDTQREIATMYCDCDCTLSEISVEKNITRQSVRDALMKALNTFEKLENSLHLAQFLREFRLALQNDDDKTALQIAEKFVEKE